jgi:hypothetical protein
MTSGSVEQVQVTDQRRAVGSCFVGLTPCPAESAEIV